MMDEDREESFYEPPAQHSPDPEESEITGEPMSSLEEAKIARKRAAFDEKASKLRAKAAKLVSQAKRLRAKAEALEERARRLEEKADEVGRRA